MSGDLPTIPEPIKDYFKRLLLGTQISILGDDMKVKNYHLLQNELKEFKKMVKERKDS